MTQEKDDAKIGLLVFLALALFLGFLFKRSLTAILKKETHLQVRLANASDLAEGTEVQLQGLRVGQVESVQLTRDGVNYGFLATLGLRKDIVLWQGTRALVVAKPLGGSFVDLQLPPPQARLAVLDPATILEGSGRPTLSTLLDDAATLVRNLNAGVQDLRASFHEKGAGVVLDHPQVSHVLQNLQGDLSAFGEVARNGQGLVAHGEKTLTSLDHNLASLQISLGHVQQLLDSRSGDLDTIIQRLAETLRETSTLGQQLNAVLATSGPHGEESIKALERSLHSAEELLELLKAKPNRAIWGKPSPAEREEAARKVKERQEARP